MSGTLTHSPSAIIQQLLIDLGYATSPADSDSWPAYISNEPDSPDNVISVFDNQGTSDGRLQTSGEQQEHHGFQVRIRSQTHPTGYTKARAIAVALDEEVGYTGVTVDSTGYTIYAISRKSEVLAIGKQHPESDLDVFTVNATAAIRQS